MAYLHNPVGLIGRFIPEYQDSVWSQYVNQYCTITEANFFNKENGQLTVKFSDGVHLDIQLHEFAEL